MAATPQACYVSGEYWLAIVDSAVTVRELRPYLERVRELDCLALVVTAPGEDCDFVSHCFGPKVAIDEDPVTGSAHSKLVPYWAERLGKTRLHARQLSRRGGELFCELRGERVTMSGAAIPYLRGTITLPAQLLEQ